MVSSESGTQGAGGCPAQRYEKVDLDETTLANLATIAHPRAYYYTMRQDDPIHYDKKLGMYLVSRWEDIQFIQRDPITFSVEQGYSEQYAKGYQEEFKAILEKEGGGFFPDAIMSDPPYHTRIRRLMEGAFSAHRVKSLEPRIRAIVVDMVEKLAEQGKADIREQFAVPMTSAIICEQLGLGDVPSETIQRWSHAVTQQIGRMQSREEMQEYAKDICELQLFLIDKIHDREKNPKEDMISDLVHAKTEDNSEPVLNFKETVSLCRAILIAGNETTATALENLFFILATKPDIAKLLRDSVDDDRLMTRFVEELLRIEPPVHGLSRMSTKEADVNGTIVPKGAHMLLMYGSGNDDETEFECPREFNMERKNLGRHVVFGGGPHRCIGAPLARMEIKVAAYEVIKRLDNFKLAVPLEELKYLPTVATRTFEHLPITFTRRT